MRDPAATTISYHSINQMLENKGDLQIADHSVGYHRDVIRAWYRVYGICSSIVS
jgi:hypothetical protein